MCLGTTTMDNSAKETPKTGKGPRLYTHVHVHVHVHESLAEALGGKRTVQVTGEVVHAIVVVCIPSKLIEIIILL